MRTCIYCLEDKDESLFQGAEHVILKSFGTFDGQTPTLNCVCDDCNQTLGREVDIAFARDSVEGDLRFSIAGKDAKDYKHLGVRTITKRTVLDHPELEGAHTLLAAGTRLPYPAPQVGILGRDGKRTWYTLDALPHRNDLDTSSIDFDSPRLYLVVGCPSAEAKVAMHEAGWEFVPKGDFVDTSGNSVIHLRQEYVLDGIRGRAVAKAAFNYMAFTQGEEVALSVAFDAARTFIRYGNGKLVNYVQVQREPILGNELGTASRFLGHVLAIRASEEEPGVWVQASFYNQVHYAIRLATNPRALREIKPVGHFFNVPARSVHELALMRIPSD